MRKLLLLSLVLLASIACSEAPKTVKIYGWEGAPTGGFDPDSLAAQMKKLKAQGIDGLFYATGYDVQNARAAARAAKAEGIEFYTWTPTLTQRGEGIDSSWYAVSREGFSAIDKPAYAGYYTFLCPNRDEVYQYVSKKYLELAAIDEVDGIHLDYVRFPDVILARGLWEKYGLTMDQEFAPYDYCYCDKCVADFKAQTGVDIRSLGDSAQYNKEWIQFRYDVVTKFVNRLADDVHKIDKKITAAVFPGPSISKKLVRQEWDKWNLDIVAPMNYNDFYLEGPDWVGTITDEEVKAAGGRMEVVSGFFICGQPERRDSIKDPEGHGLIPSEMGVAVKGVKAAGAEGICLFMPNRMTDEHWAALHKAIDEK